MCLPYKIITNIGAAETYVNVQELSAHSVTRNGIPIY